MPEDILQSENMQVPAPESHSREYYNPRGYQPAIESLEIEPEVVQQQNPATAISFPTETTFQKKLEPQTFDWEKTQADRYVQDKNYKNLGFEPFAAPVQIDGQQVNYNELKYEKAMTFGHAMDKAAGGFAAITRNAFTEGWKGDARLFNALFGAPFSDQTFRERLIGTPEELAEMDAETKRIMNKYAIYHTPESDNTVFNKQFLGDVIQQMGFTVGTAGQMLAEAALTWGIGEAFSAAAKGMRAGAMAERVATGAKAIPRGEIINDLRKAGNISQNTAAMKDMVSQFGRWSAKQMNPLTGAQDVLHTIEAGGTGWQVAMSTVGGAKRLFSQTNMAATEARFEAAGTFGQMYGDLTSKYQDTHDGQLPTGDDLMRIQKAAYGAATDNFIVNTGILMTMNQLQFGNMFSKFSSSSKLMREALSQGEGKLFKVTGEIAGKKTSRMVSGLGEVRKNFGMGTMLYTMAKRAVTGTAAKFELTEGLQEILQETSNEALREHYTNLYNGNKDLDGRNILDAEWGDALKKQYSQDGWRTFLMGAVTGLAMSPLQASVMYGVRKGYGKVSDSYKKDIEGGKLQKEENKNIQNAFYGNIDNVLNEHIANLKVQGQGAKEMEQSLADGDKYTYMNAKDDILTKAIASSLKTGTYESIIDSINEYADMSDEELHDAFPALEKTASSTRSAREYIGSIAEDIKQYHDNWESLKERYGHLIMPELYKGQNNQRIMQATKKKLDEAIELLATTSYHITSTINRANAVHTEVSEYPSIGSVLYSAFDKLADPKQLDTEIMLLEQEQAILDELGRDKEIQEDKKNVRERLKLLQQWKNEQSQETFEKYIEADYNQMPQGKMDRSNLHTAYERLQEYKNIKKDNENYVDALNMLNNPTAFAKLLERLEDALAYAGKEQYKEQDKESNDIVDEEFGHDEPDITDEDITDETPEDIDRDRDSMKKEYVTLIDATWPQYQQNWKMYPELLTEIDAIRNTATDAGKVVEAIHKEIDRYFDKKVNDNTERGSYPELVGNPHVAKAKKKYKEKEREVDIYKVVINEKELKLQWSLISDANKELDEWVEENHPIIPQTEYREGQVIYDGETAYKLVYDKKKLYVRPEKEGTRNKDKEITLEELGNYTLQPTAPTPKDTHTPFDDSQVKSSDPWATVNVGANDYNEEKLTDNILSIPDSHLGTGEGFRIVVTVPEVVQDDIYAIRDKNKEPLNTQIIQKGQPYSIRLEHEGITIGYITNPAPQIYIAPDGTEKTVGQLTESDVAALYTMTKQFPTAAKWLQHLQQLDNYGAGLQAIIEKALKNGGTLDIDSTLQLEPHYTYDWIETGETGPKLSELQGVVYGKNGRPKLYVHNNYTGDRVEAMGITPQEEAIMAAIQPAGQVSYYTGVVQLENGRYIPIQLTPRQISTEEGKELVEGISNVTNNAGIERANNLLSKMFVALRVYDKGKEYEKNIGISPRIAQDSKGFYMYIPVYQRDGKETTPLGKGTIRPEKGQPLVFTSLEDMVEKMNIAIENRSTKGMEVDYVPIEQLTTDNIKWQPNDDITDMECSVRKNIVKSISLTYKVPDKGQQRVNESKPAIVHEPVPDVISDSLSSVGQKLFGKNYSTPGSTQDSSIGFSSSQYKEANKIREELIESYITPALEELEQKRKKATSTPEGFKNHDKIWEQYGIDKRKLWDDGYAYIDNILKQKGLPTSEDEEKALIEAIERQSVNEPVQVAPPVIIEQESVSETPSALPEDYEVPDLYEGQTVAPTEEAMDEMAKALSPQPTPENLRAQEMIDEMEADRKRDEELKAKKGVPKVSTLTETDVEDINRFTEFMKNLPANIFSVGELDTVAAHMGDMGVTVGQFVTYLDELGNVRGRIETTDKAPYKYHEAFHGVFRLLLTTEEQKELRKQAPNPNKEQLDTLRITHPRYTDMGTAELTDEWKEEWMADRFNEYSINWNNSIERKDSTVWNTLFNKILKWIQYIIDSVVGNRLRAMSYKVHTGDYSNARLQQNEYTENVTTSVAVPKAILIGYEKTTVNLSDGGTKEVIVDKYLSPGLASQVAADITAMVILDMKAQKYTSYDKAVEAALNRYEESYYPASQRNLDTLNSIRNKATRDRMKQDLKDLYKAVSKVEPRQVFKDNILQLLRIQGIKQQMLEEDDTDEAGRSFQDKSTIGGYSTVPSDMRTYIATTTMKVRDMFGYEEYADGTPIRQAVDSNRVYNGMLSMLSQKSDVSDMIDDILGDHSNNPDLQAFINRWISESGFDVERYKETGDMYVGDTNLFHKVIKTFAQHNNDYVAVVMDPETKRVMVTDAGRRAPERHQFNSWANAFYQNYYKELEQFNSNEIERAAELYREAIKPIDRLINQTLTTSDRETAIDDEELSVVSKEISYDIQEKLGINWHPDYIKYTIIAGKNITARTTDQSKFLLLYPTVGPIDEKGLKSLKGILKGLENPFVRDESAVIHPIETWLLKTARYNGVFDNNVDTMSFTNSLGDNIYKYQYPNYNTRTVQALNGEKLRELQNNPETQSSYLLSDQRFLAMDKKLILLGGLSLKSWGINKEDNEEFIYTKDQDTAGTDFSKMDDREYAVMNFSLYDITTNTDAVKKDSEGNTYYRVPVSLGPIAEKGTHHCVYIPVGHWIENGKITEEAKQAIYNEVVAEVNRIQQCWSEIQEGREAVIDRGGLWIDGYHDGAQRGLKLMSTDALMNRSVGGEETVKQLLEEKALIPGYDVEQERGDIYTAIEAGLKEQIEALKKLLISQELMTEKGKNLLLPQYLWSGLDSYDDKKKERDSKMNLIAGKFNHNLSQVYLQNYIGYIGLSRMLYGDKAKSSKSTEDWWKRQAGNNGSTTNMAPVASSESQNPVKTVKTVLYASEKFTTIAGTTGEYDDGQAYITAQGYDTFLNGLGRNSESRKRIIEKVANGKDLTIEEYRQLLANKEAMGSLKPVAKDMYPYYKCSISALLRQDSSYKVNGEWVKLPGRDYLHDKLESAEEMENTGETVLIGNKTISKGMTANLVQADDEDIQKFYTDLNANVLGIQTEMPMTGHKGNKSTQPDKQITSGQIPTAPVYLNGKWQTAADAIRQYMDSVAQRKVNNAITAISESFSPITNLDEAYKVKFDAGKFMEKALPTLQASGTDSQTLEMMTPIDGLAQYNLNMPSIVSKAENIYMSNMIKGVTKEKVPMWKLTLRSDAGMSVIRKVTSLYPQGHEKEGQPKTWEIVPMDMFKKDPSKYSSVWEYKLNKDTDRFEGLTEGVYVADRLRDTVPQYDESGKVLYYYTEGMRAYMSEDEKRNGKFADAWSEGMGARTPGTGFQSYRRVRWVDRVSDVLYGTGILSRDVMNATGHDYDADALYTAIPDTYMVNGQRVLYGTAGTLPEQYREYKEWQLDNNKEVQKLYYGDKWVEGEDPVAALMDKSSMRDLSSEVNNYRLEQILKGLKMPANVEEFKQMGGVELNNGVLTNRALEAQMTLLSSESVAGGGKDALINRPTSTQPVVKFGERLAEKLTDSTSPWAQEVVNRLSGNTGDMNGMLGQIQAYKGLQQGGEGIGPIANMIQVASVLNQHGVEVKHKPYMFNGETYDEYTGSKHTPWHTRTGAVDILAQMHVDATKDQLPSKWAITAEYAQLLSNIIHLGQDMETALLYPQTYPWQVYAQRVAYSRRTFSLRDSRQSEDAILQDMKNKVAQKGGKRINLTQDIMIDYISKGERNWDVEYTLLDDLDTMKQNVEPLKYMSRFMRFDTGRLLSSWEEMAHVQKGLSELGIGMPEDKYQAMKVPVDVRDIITKENKSLAANYKIMRVIDALGRKVFIEKTNLYKNIHTAVLETLTVPEYRKEWYKNLKMDILSYISLTAYMKMLRDRIRPEVLDTLDNDLIWSDGDKSIITILTDLRDQNRKNYAINSFLNTVLKGAKKSANINQVVANTWTRLSEQQQQNVVKGIIELVSSEKGDVHKGGIALFNYLLVKDGGQFKSGSFIRFIPPFMMKEWSDSMTKITDMLSDPKSSEETYRELFGMESNMLRDKFVEAYATHKDNQEYVKGNMEYYRDNLKLYRTLPDGKVVEITPDGDSYQWKGAKAVFGNYPTTQQSAPKPSTTKTTVPTITYYEGTEAITIDESGNEVMKSAEPVVPSQQMQNDLFQDISTEKLREMHKVFNKGGMLDKQFQDYEMTEEQYNWARKNEKIVKNILGNLDDIEDVPSELVKIINNRVQGNLFSQPQQMNKAMTVGKVKAIEKGFDDHVHPDIDFYIKGHHKAGTVTDESLMNLCDMTSLVCVHYLQTQGVNVFPSYFKIYPKLPIANFKGNMSNHKVAISYINNKMYIFDMPQNEYITLNNKGQAVFNEFKPRFIEVTPENMQKYYGIDKKSYEDTFYKFAVGDVEIPGRINGQDASVSFQKSISEWFKEGSPVYSSKDYIKRFLTLADTKRGAPYKMEDTSVQPTYTYTGEKVPNKYIQEKISQQMTPEQWKQELSAIYSEKKRDISKEEWMKKADALTEKARKLNATDEVILNTLRCK